MQAFFFVVRLPPATRPHIWSECTLAVRRVIIDLIVLSLDYCRVNGCDADGDYSIISNCTRQHLQMEPCVFAKNLLGSQLFIQQWFSELADFFSTYEFRRTSNTIK